MESGRKRVSSIDDGDGKLFRGTIMTRRGDVAAGGAGMPNVRGLGV